MGTTTHGCHVASQITAYTMLVLSAQYCTHVFLVLIIKTLARIIHWDCGGAVITAPISYNQDPKLFNFLICYDNASCAIRGQDCTVDLPTDIKAQNAHKLPDLADAKSLLAITISDPGCSHESNHYVILPPCAHPDMLRSDYTTYADTLDCLVPFLSNPYTVAHVRSSDFLVASLYDTI